MTRLEELRTLREFIDREIAAEVERMEATDEACTKVIIQAARLYDVDPGEVTSGSRRRRITLARQAACWMLRHHLGLSYPRIAGLLNLDHTSALYACRKIDASPSVRALLLGLEVA